MIKENVRVYRVYQKGKKGGILEDVDLKISNLEKLLNTHIITILSLVSNCYQDVNITTAFFTKLVILSREMITDLFVIKV